MKNSLFVLAACAFGASIASAAPASKTAVKTPNKTAPAKVAAKPVAKSVAAKAPVKVAAGTAATASAKAAPARIAQADSMMKPEEMPGFFPDVPRDHWAFAAVQRLAAAGIVQGYPATPAQAANAKVADAKSADVKVADATVADAKVADAKVADAKVADAKVAAEATPERVAAVPTPEAEKVAAK